MVALSLVFVTFPVQAQVIDDEYNKIDLVAGETTYSSPAVGVDGINRFLVRKVGLAGFNWSALAGIAAGQPYRCSTKMRFSDLVPAYLVQAMSSYSFLCRDNFQVNRDTRIVVGPPSQSLRYTLRDRLGEVDSSGQCSTQGTCMPDMHWYQGMFTTGWYPAKTRNIPSMKGLLPKPLGCRSLATPPPGINLKVVEWSSCRHSIQVEQYTLLIGFVSPLDPSKVVYVTYAGNGFFNTIPLPTLVAEMTAWLGRVQPALPGA